MQAVCTELERNFTKCNEDLDAIAKKLDEDFESSNAYKRNPLQLLQRVKALQDDLPKVQEEWQRVMVAKQTIIDLARQHQMANRRTLKQLHVTVEVEGEENEAPFERFRGIHEGWEQENRSRVESMQTELFGQTLLAPEELNMEVMRTAGARRDAEEDEEGVAAEAEAKAEEAESSEAAGQEGAEEKLPAHVISEEEFTSVSNIVRGRCKIEECNELLELIIRHSKKIRGAPIITAKLVELGGRVTGQTGGSRLATLRSLKRITISKEGVVINPKYLQ